MGGAPIDHLPPKRHGVGMTDLDLQDVLLAALVRRHGGDRRRWRAAMGRIKVHALETHAHCNWSVAPSGSAGENAAIERLLDEMRGTYPIVSG